MNAQFSARLTTTPDALWAVASYVAKEYGSDGYTIGIAHTETPVVVFEVAHSDGSRFNVIADRWGNVQEIPEASSLQDAMRQVMAMRRDALTL